MSTIKKSKYSSFQDYKKINKSILKTNFSKSPMNEKLIEVVKGQKSHLNSVIPQSTESNEDKDSNFGDIKKNQSNVWMQANCDSSLSKIKLWVSDEHDQNNWTSNKEKNHNECKNEIFEKKITPSIQILEQKLNKNKNTRNSKQT